MCAKFGISEPLLIVIRNKNWRIGPSTGTADMERDDKYPPKTGTSLDESRRREVKNIFVQVVSQLENNFNIQFAILSGGGLVAFSGIILTYVVKIAPYIGR